MPENQLRNQSNIDEIIGAMPSSIIRYGMSFLALFLVLILVAGWVIKIPDKLTARIIITSVNPPANIVPKYGGKILKLYVQNKEEVHKNQLLATLESDANNDDIEWLNNNITTFKNFENNPNLIYNTINNKTVLVGGLSTAYNQFTQAFRNYFIALTNNSSAQQVASLSKQLTARNLLQKNYIDQKEIAQQQLKLEFKQFTIAQKLYEKKIMSKVDVDEAEKRYLTQEYALKTAQLSIDNNILVIEQTKAQISSYQSDYKLKNIETYNQVKNAISLLENELYTWSKNYSLHSPVDGVVSFNAVWSENQIVTPQQNVFTINQKNQQTFGRIALPMFNTGKLKTGQTVWIKLDNYPFQKNGILKGTIQTISDIPFDNNYIVSVALPQNLVTSFRKKIPHKPEMQGSAEIILENERLIVQILSKFIGTKNK